MKIIHLKRKDKEACIKSLSRNIQMFPKFHGYYSELEPQNCLLMRITAFHYQEMTRTDWQALNLRDKLSWYYDKTHQLIEAKAKQFNHYIKINTEDLSQIETLEKLVKFLNKDFDLSLPSSSFLNTYQRYFLLETIPSELYRKTQFIFKCFDISKVNQSGSYTFRYFSIQSLLLLDKALSLNIRSSYPWIKNELNLILNKLHFLRKFLFSNEQEKLIQYFGQNHEAIAP